MKKLLFIASGFLLSHTFSFGQFKQLGASATFAEPESGFTDLIKGKNGNTYYLHFERKGKLNIKCYSSGYQLLFEKSTLFLKKGEQLTNVIASFEVNRQLVLLVESHADLTPVLTRLIIDMDEGNISENTELARLTKISKSELISLALEYKPLPTFYARKASTSDAYAVVSFNTITTDNTRRIGVMHFDQNNSQLSNAYFKFPDSERLKCFFRDIFVDDDKSALVVVKSGTLGKSGTVNENIFIGELANGESDFAIKKLPMTNAGNIEGIMLRYNPVMQRFIMLSNRGDNKSVEKRSFTVSVSTFDKKIENFENRDLDLESIKHIAQTTFNRKEKLNVIPQTFTINDDGSYTIGLEELQTKVIIAPQTQAAMSNTRTRIYLNNIGVIKYDTSHSVLSAHYLPKSQLIVGNSDILISSFRETRPTHLAMGTQYSSFKLLRANGKSYILTNDAEKNINKIKEKKKVNTIQTLDDSEGFYYDISDKGIPKGERVNIDRSGNDKTLLLFAVGVYDQENNVYTVMETSRGKKARIVWLQP